MNEEKAIAHWCEGKFRHKSPQAARRALPKNGRPVSVYKCGTCHGFHVGSSDGFKTPVKMKPRPK